MAKANSINKGKTYNLNSPVLNILLVVICVLGMGGSLRFFQLDMKKTNQQLDEKPVGTVYWAENTVQCLSSRYQQWNRLERYSSVYDGDVISTAAFSEAKINFVNGENLELSENTSVQIKYKEEIPTVEFRGGEIDVRTDRSGLLISLAGTGEARQEQGEGQVEASAVKVNLDPRSSASMKALDDTTFKLYQGSGTISSGGESRELNGRNAFKIWSDGQFLTDLPIMILSPGNGARILRSKPGKAPVQFLWQKLASMPDSGVWLEIAETKDFANPTGSWYSENDDSMEIDLPEGTYFWKAYVYQSLDEVDSGRLEIVYTPGPGALSPSNGSVQTYQAGKQDLRFSWAVPEEAEAVLLEVAANPDMTRPRIRQLIRRTKGGYGSFVSSELGTGQWYWRVYPVYPGGISEGDIFSSSSGAGQGFWRVRPINADILAEDVPSPINSFTLVEASEKPNLTNTPLVDVVQGDSLRLVFPLDNYTLEASRTPDLFFSWKNPLSYNAKLQISERSDFSSSLVAEEDAVGSSIQGLFLRPGTYYWRITGNGGSSLPTRLVVEPALAAPKLESPRDNERLRLEETNAVNFTWERMNYANYYVFRLFLEGRDTPLTEISSLQNNMVLVYFDPKTAGRFRWTVQGFSSPTDVSSGRNGLIAQGHFIISPQTGSNQSGQIIWTNPRITNIQTFEGSVHSPVTLVAPAAGTNIPGTQALRSPIEARWTTEEPLTNVQLIVSRTSDPLTDPRAIVKDAGASSATFPSLSEGIWYWIVRGDTSDGRGATAGDSRWLNVLPIPLLPAPGAIQPEDQSVIGIAQLTQDRNITFRWNEVEGANSYIFSLFRAPAEDAAATVSNAPADTAADTVSGGISDASSDNASDTSSDDASDNVSDASSDDTSVSASDAGTSGEAAAGNDTRNPPILLVTAAPGPELSYVLKDLAILNQGKYLWQVEAIYQNNIGTIEQRGKIELHPFTIEIQRSSGFQTQSQGTMYGQ